MVRCYEFYVVIKKNPVSPICFDKSDRMLAYIKQYMRIMEKTGVKFDGSEVDKLRFKEIRDSIGSERKATQGLKSLLKSKIKDYEVDSDEVSNYAECNEWNQLSADLRRKIVFMTDALRKEINELMGLLTPTSGNILLKLAEVQRAIDEVSEFFSFLDMMATIVVERAEKQRLKKIKKVAKKAEEDRVFKTEPEPGQTTLPEVTSIVQ